jgi:uncharacterized protein (DUF924 family)
MPLEHSECVEDVEECLWRLATLLDDPVNAQYIGMGIQATRDHLTLLKQFKRYPYRNAVLGRESTPQELVYLSGIKGGFEASV